MEERQPEKMGSSLGGSQYFANGFESGDLSAWSSSSSAVSVVADSATGELHP